MLRPTYPLPTERLELRPFRESDLDDLYDIQSHPEVARYMYWHPRTRDQVRGLLRERITQSVLRHEGDRLSLAVVHRGGERLIGEVTLIWLSRDHGSGEIGYSFHPDEHGKGLATEATEVVLRLAFDDLGLHRVIGRLDGRNTASARVLERLGMRREAHFVENEYVKGEWTDELVYAMLAPDWKSRHATQPQ